MKMKHSYLKIAAAASAFTLVAGGLIVWNVPGVDAAVRDRLERFQVAREARDAVQSILTEEQKTVLEAFRGESKEVRAERRAFLEAQRDVLAEFQLTPRQWEELSRVADTHGQAVVDGLMGVVDGRVTLRKATLAEDGTEEAMRAAATALGTLLGDAAVAVKAALADARDILTAEQRTMLHTVVENVSARRDETRYANAERFLELRSDLDLTGVQKAAIASALREVLNHLPMDFGPEL